MLKEKHLAVVRAALKFLDEEMSPHGAEELLAYLDDRTNSVSIEDVKVAREIFNAVDLSYALVDSAGVVIESERLVPAASLDELSFQSDLSVLASVLVPSQ